MAKFSLLMALPPLVFAGLASLFIFGMNRDDPNQLPSAKVGKAAPSVENVTGLGDLALLSDDMLRTGDVKLINYWASWCAPCRAEHPQLETLSEQGITVYGINYKDKADAALGFLTEMGNPYNAIGADVPGRTALEWGLYGVPETYILDAKGEITYRFAGPITEEILEKYIKPEIEKAAK
jgi:cytochrome c biogenesis protein CcmG/thiol:disulfide interchange protein DsbE